MPEELSQHINDELRQILSRSDIPENEKRARETVLEGIQSVAECLTNWRRSRFYDRCWALNKHGPALQWAHGDAFARNPTSDSS